jgi:hypothetical protein
MSLTEARDEERDRHAEEREADKDRSALDFFREVLVPVALSERARGREYFALRPDASSESYYVEPTKREMQPADFELRASESIEAFVRELAALWSSEGREDLAAMAPRLTSLAYELREDEEQSDDVSPFMYVMF